MSRRVTAGELARDMGIDPAKFGLALRQAEERGEITWHQKGQRWVARLNSPEHHDMERVLGNLINYDMARERLRG